ncbi:endonuclease NucS [Halovenus sp. HT40]|uniref:endonuclease NucS n=1 Tax=Halovenus sp. HT40 TaxID=3126691 RepID=UPI00300F3AC1
MTEQGLQAHSAPTVSEALDLLESGIAGERLITLFGRCRVEYDGRAASSLDAGNRLVVLKPDGTILVHTDSGQQPVNWQPPGCTHEGRLDDGELLVESVRTNPDERLLVAFERVDQVVVYDGTGDSDVTVLGTEADLRDRILDRPELVEEGFEPRATERDTSAGAVDIYGTDSDDNAVVVELKRRRVGPDAVSQLNRYVEALESDLHAGRTVRGILVAPSVTDRAHNLLERRGLEFVSVSPTPE